MDNTDRERESGGWTWNVYLPNVCTMCFHYTVRAGIRTRGMETTAESWSGQGNECHQRNRTQRDGDGAKVNEMRYQIMETREVILSIIRDLCIKNADAAGVAEWWMDMSWKL